MTPERTVLVTGGTGYVGGNLAQRLLEKGYRVRVLARHPERLNGRSWFRQVELVQGDTVFPEVVNEALRGISVAFYLIHNMNSGQNYMEKEIESARNFGSTAETAGVEHIIYLGGLADPDKDMGEHLRSRILTGDILRQGKVPVTEFRSSLIIGSGSISFEMIRFLTEQFPILAGPRWVYNCSQPIAIQNVLDYLVAALENDSSRGKIYEIGGKDVLTYAEALDIYARLRGLKRRVVAVPGLSVNFIARMTGILTPVPSRIAGPLFEGMCSDSVVRSDLAIRDFPGIHPAGYETAVSLALDRLTPGSLEVPWENDTPSFKIRKEGFFIEGQRIRLQVRPESVFSAVTGLGGRRGWLYLNGLWKLRGFFDRLVGGQGSRRRRKDDELIEGDVLGFYRVDLLEKDRLMRLRAELKAPGQGWMEWKIQAHPEGDASLMQIAYFAPKGTAGFLYWYLLLPFHRLVFTGLNRAIARRAVEIQNLG